MRIHTRFPLGVALLLSATLALLPGCGKKNQESAEGGGGARRAAPDFSLKDLQGNDVSLSQFRGKVVILDFWATWCPPCKMEIPHFIDLQNRYGSEGLEVVGISLDNNAAAVVPPFVQQNGINYTMLLGNMSVASAYGGVQNIPTTFVLDKKGRVAASFVGYNDKSVFEDLARRLLAEG